MPERVDDLFSEYAVAYTRGERPVTAEFLRRAAAGTDELARLIDGFLASAPVPQPDEQTVTIFEAWRARESPLARLRVAEGLTLEGVVGALVRALHLEPQKNTKVIGYYEQLEAGSLDPTKVDRRVWDALAEVFHARVGDLLAPASPPFHSLAAPSALARPMMAAMRDSEAYEEPKDEVDRLFGAV